MKKLNIYIAIVVLAIGIGGYLYIDSIEPYLGAQIISTENSAGLSKSFTAPKSPDFLNTFNLFTKTKSELGLIEKYSGQVMGASKSTMKDYQMEILSYVDRIVDKPHLSGYLPMWPDHNVALYGNVLAYLSPNELDPLAYAKDLGLVPVSVKANSYLSRAEFLSLIGNIFMSPEKDPADVLADLGFIDSAVKWNDESKNGFPLVEGIRLILNIRDLIEQKSITAAKLEYSANLTTLSEGELVLDDNTLAVLVRVFAAEAQSGFEESVLEIIKSKFSSQYGATLTAQDISKLRSAFFKATKQKEAPVYQLPDLQLIGDCDNEVFRKTYMGPVAVTGPKGANIICDKALISFPANSYLINVFSLPKISEIELSDQLGVATIRTEAIRSYENALIVSDKGEKMVGLLLKPRGIKNMSTQSFGVSVEDLEGNILMNLEKQYIPAGAYLELRLRSFVGDQLLKFKYKM